MPRPRIRPRTESVEFKDAITYFAVATALSYALGWVVQSFSVMQLNMGPVGVPKETAIASGIACLLTFLPIAAVVLDRLYHQQRNLPQPKLQEQAFALFLAVLFPFAITEAVMVSTVNRKLLAYLFGHNNWTPVIVVLLGAAEAVLLSFLYRMRDKSAAHLKAKGITDETRDDLASNGLLRFYLGFVIVLCIGLHIVEFGRHTLPRLQPAYGGYIGHNVAVRFKENDPKTKEAEPLGPFYKMTIIVADDNSCVLAPGWYNEKGIIPEAAHFSPQGKRTHEPMIKVRWDNILELQEVRLPLSGTFWTPSNPPRYKPLLKADPSIPVDPLAGDNPPLKAP